MSDDIETWLRAQVDDDETLAESDYDIVISARKVRDVAAEITRLRAELATARREGMEHVHTRILWHQHDQCSGWRELSAFDKALEIIKKEIDAIRAAAGEGKP